MGKISGLYKADFLCKMVTGRLSAINTDELSQMRRKTATKIGQGSNQGKRHALYSCLGLAEGSGAKISCFFSGEKSLNWGSLYKLT